MNKGERPKQLTIEIDQKHIDNGTARDSRRCIIADAIADAHPDWRRISVDVATIRASDPKRGIRAVYITPPSLQRLILNVDQGNRKAIKPMKVRVCAAMIVPVQQRSEKEKAKMRKTWKAKYAKKKVLKSHGGPGKVPIVSGGKLPPIAKGAVRAYGLRGMMV